MRARCPADFDGLARPLLSERTHRARIGLRRLERWLAGRAVYHVAQRVVHEPETWAGRRRGEAGG